MDKSVVRLMSGSEASEFEQKSCANKDSTQTFPDHQLSKWMMIFFWRGMSIWSFIQKKFQGLANISSYFFCNSVQTQFEWLEWVRLKRLKWDVKMSNIWKVLGSRYNHNWHYDVVVLGFCTQKPPHISIMQYLPILLLFLFCKMVCKHL